jgi:hypothetical protein
VYATLNSDDCYPKAAEIPFRLYYVYSGTGIFMMGLNFYWFYFMINSVASRFKVKDEKKRN